VFGDYMRGAMRLAAIMKLNVTYVMTHDSIGVGEDGPTHQPTEHLASFRAMPGMRVVRPADANETVAAWKAALTNDGPTILALTRQGVPLVTDAAVAAAGTPRGAYIVRAEGSGEPDIILIATGSEVTLATDAHKSLANKGVASRVVSMPSWELFEDQDADYRESVLPRSVTRRLSIEAGTTFGWERYVRSDGDSIGIDRFGLSAPGATVFREFGITAEAITERAAALVRGG
jgi:transketolase